VADAVEVGGPVPVGIFTVWSERALVSTVPRSTTRRKSRSRAISQRTRSGAPSPLPGVATGSPRGTGGVARVQITTAFPVESPLATP